jgi:chromosome segregation ATPase
MDMDEESAPATVDVQRQRRLASRHMEEQRSAAMSARRDIAMQMQNEQEQRIAAAEVRQAAQARKEYAAGEQAWRQREAEMKSALGALEADRVRLEREVETHSKQLKKAADAAVQHAALASGDREELLALHAAALEVSAARNDTLSRENERLLVQQGLLEEEVQRAEHESTLNSIEMEEVRNAMAAAVQELVPLRQEVVEQRQQLVEVSRAAAQLKNAKEENQASFLIAKCARATRRGASLRVQACTCEPARASLRVLA